MTTAVFNLALATVARDEGSDTDHRAVRVLDQAGWHRRLRWAVPEGSHGVVRPFSSPELHPAARMGPLGDEPVANRAFALDTRETVPVERCRLLEADRGQITSHTLFPWWPTESPA